MRNNLKTLRIQKKMTLEDVAFKSGLAFTTIWRTEKGQIVPTISTCAKIAVALGVTLDDLFTLESINEK
ncbi:MAG TPA: helix-turn-helix transcriptional regulator [Petrotogaceae bacterium]|jgi:transcriptional regulator with XRE-family HTH domain|nr:helix-turn-helix transcriptional regulator [Petrotogaceae bacterium]